MLRTTAIRFFAAFLAASSFHAQSAPLPQKCSSLEVAQAGSTNQRFKLDCSVGDWRLTYSGTVPPGSTPMSARYRLDLVAPDGQSKSLTRSSVKTVPANIAQVLAHEAVLLDDGTLGLRDCSEPNCKVFKPVDLTDKPVSMPHALEGQAPGQEQPSSESAELARLKHELEKANQRLTLVSSTNVQLTESLKATQAELASQAVTPSRLRVTKLENDIKKLTEQLTRAREDLRASQEQSAGLAVPPTPLQERPSHAAVPEAP